MPNVSPSNKRAPAGAFCTLVGLLQAGAVAIDDPTTLRRSERDRRSAVLCEALAARGTPATAIELGAAVGVPPNRIGVILAHDIAAGRVIAWRDARTPFRTLLYALAPRPTHRAGRGQS